jgi:hypothetical protein
MPKIPKDCHQLKSLELVWKERILQKEVEGYTAAHDDEHTEGQLALLAATYALSSQGNNQCSEAANLVYLELDVFRGWGDRFKPKEPIRDLVRAGALILAELERRLRAAEK